MKQLSSYHNRSVFWFDYHRDFNQLPDKDWICLAISDVKPPDEKFEDFVRACIDRNITEFKAWGKYCDWIHDTFDEIGAFALVIEGQKQIDTITTSHNDQTLADAFWQCFFATSIPITAGLKNISIICTGLDGTDRSAELESYLDSFKKGWLPEK